MEYLNHVCRQMGAAVAELRDRVAKAERLSGRMAVRDALMPLHRQLRWMVPMHRALVALRQQSKSWVLPPEFEGKAAKAYLKRFLNLEKEVQRCCTHMSAESYLGPMLEVPLLKAEPGLKPCHWRVVKLGDFVSAERDRLQQASKARSEAVRACALGLDKFLDSLQPEQQELLREAMRQPTASGRGRSLDLGPVHFAKLGL